MKDLSRELVSLLSETGECRTKVYTMKDLEVKLLDYPKNPYKSIFEMATQTWGYPGKWSKASPELRFKVVKDVLENKALPLALEAPKFTFQINNCTRASFDQIARARVGVVFAARGYKDNDLSDEGFVLPMFDLEEEDLQEVLSLVMKSKKLYCRLRKKYPGWVSRIVIPMYLRYNFIMSITYLSLRNFCSKRMTCMEMPDTVGVAFLLRETLAKKFFLLANYLKSFEMIKHECVVPYWNGFSEEIGVPHAPCKLGTRRKVKSEWNFPCTDHERLFKELNIKPEYIEDISLNDLSVEEAVLFEEA